MSGVTFLVEKTHEAADSDDLAGVPESWLRTDSGTVATIDQWIQGLHPSQCEEIAVRLPSGGNRFFASSVRLTAHCIERHERGLDSLVGLTGRLGIYDERELGLGEAISGAQGRIADELVRMLP